MRIDGYEITRTGNEILIKEVSGEQTKSWQAMLAFCARFPTGHEPEWGSFVKKHTSMQQREIDAALREYRKERMFMGKDN